MPYIFVYVYIYALTVRLLGRHGAQHMGGEECQRAINRQAIVEHRQSVGNI